MNAGPLWRKIAKLREAEGDPVGAARARRNADAYALRRYQNNDTGEVVWDKAAYAKYLGVPS